jgi:hypothetical protein
MGSDSGQAATGIPWASEACDGRRAASPSAPGPSAQAVIVTRIACEPLVGIRRQPVPTTPPWLGRRTTARSSTVKRP